MSRPRIFGILNITEDSFSDGGRFLSPDHAIAQAQALVAAGADVLDVGPASSHPDAQYVPPEAEIDRLQAVWPELRALNCPISLDSYHVETQRWALAQGVDWLNDVTGFPHPELYPELAESACRLVVMHAVQSKGMDRHAAQSGQGRAQRIETDANQMMAQIKSFFDERLNALSAAGIAKDRLVIDPGMGFFLGNQPDVSLRVLAQLDDLKSTFGLPVLLSVSRKSFLRAQSQRALEDIGPMSLAAELWACQLGVDYIRTHEVDPLKDALDLYATLRQHRKAL